MQKDTIEIARYKEHIKGYGLINPPYGDSPETLDHLIEWSNKYPNRKIYRTPIIRDRRTTRKR